jgi:hypothetical protein
MEELEAKRQRAEERLLKLQLSAQTIRVLTKVWAIRRGVCIPSPHTHTHGCVYGMHKVPQLYTRGIAVNDVTSIPLQLFERTLERRRMAYRSIATVQRKLLQNVFAKVCGQPPPVDDAMPAGQSMAKSRVPPRAGPGRKVTHGCLPFIRSCLRKAGSSGASGSSRRRRHLSLTYADG